MELILSLWPVAVYAAYLCLYARKEALEDAELIDRQQLVDHRKGWLVRCLEGGGPALFVAAILNSWWSILPLLTLGAFLFSAVFRARLNKLRGLHPCYVSNSNAYDGFFLWLAVRPHTHNYLDGKKWGQSWSSYLRRAGRLAYICESTLVALSIYAVGVIVNKNLNP